MMMGLHVQAQKFLDFYYQGSVVSSVNASDIDSVVIGTNPTNRTIGLYKAALITAPIPPSSSVI